MLKLGYIIHEILGSYSLSSRHSMVVVDVLFCRSLRGRLMFSIMAWQLQYVTPLCDALHILVSYSVREESFAAGSACVHLLQHHRHHKEPSITKYIIIIRILQTQDPLHGVPAPSRLRSTRMQGMMGSFPKGRSTTLYFSVRRR